MSVYHFESGFYSQDALDAMHYGSELSMFEFEDLSCPAVRSQEPGFFEENFMNCAYAPSAEGMNTSLLPASQVLQPTADVMDPSCNADSVLSDADILAVLSAFLPSQLPLPKGDFHNDILSHRVSVEQNAHVQLDGGEFNPTSSFVTGFVPKDFGDASSASSAASSPASSFISPVSDVMKYIEPGPAPSSSSVASIYIDHGSTVLPQQAASLHPQSYSSPASHPSRSAKRTRKFQVAKSNPFIHHRGSKRGMYNQYRVRNTGSGKNKYKYQCPFCPAILGSPAAFRRHFLRWDHGGEGFPCKYCGELATREDSRNRHEKDVHGHERTPKRSKSSKK